MSQIGMAFVIEVRVFRDLGKRLLDIFHIVVGFHLQHGIRIDLSIIELSDNRAAIDPAVIEEQRIGATSAKSAGNTSRLCASCLSLICEELTLRQPSRHFRIEPVIDSFEVEVLLVVYFIFEDQFAKLYTMGRLTTI